MSDQGTGLLAVAAEIFWLPKPVSKHTTDSEVILLASDWLCPMGASAGDWKM